MPLSYLIDVNVNRAITAAVRDAGIDVATAQELGVRRKSDPELLDLATEQGRVLFSQDQDFPIEATKRQREGRFFGGVVYSAQRLSVGVCVRDLTLMGLVYEPQEMHSRLVYLPL